MAGGADQGIGTAACSCYQNGLTVFPVEFQAFGRAAAADSGQVAADIERTAGFPEIGVYRVIGTRVIGRQAEESFVFELYEPAAENASAI